MIKSRLKDQEPGLVQQSIPPRALLCCLSQSNLNCVFYILNSYVRYILNGQVPLLWEAGKTLVYPGEGTRERGFAHLGLGLPHAAPAPSMMPNIGDTQQWCNEQSVRFQTFQPRFIFWTSHIHVIPMGKWKRKGVFFTRIEQRCKILYMSSFMFLKKNMFPDNAKHVTVFLHMNPWINSWRACKLNFGKTNQFASLFINQVILQAGRICFM